MYGWRESFAIGVPTIDAQHKQLFEITAELHQAMMRGQSKFILGQIMDKLIDYTAKHFNAEESMLRTKGYTELPRHRLIHDQFTAKIKNLQQEHQAGTVLVTIDLMDFLQKWLVTHIQGTDTEYVRELRLVA